MAHSSQAGPLTTWPIPASLADRYSGAGHALAAVAGGQLVALVYLRELLPNLQEDDDGDELVDQHVLADPRIAPTVRLYSSLGTVHLGMCSGWTYTEL